MILHLLQLTGDSTPRVIIVAGTYNLNISLDLSTIFKHTALADTALCMIANRVDTQSVDVSLNTAKSFMNFVFFMNWFI